MSWFSYDFETFDYMPLKMLYLIGPDGLVNRNNANFLKNGINDNGTCPDRISFKFASAWLTRYADFIGSYQIQHLKACFSLRWLICMHVILDKFNSGLTLPFKDCLCMKA